jgi:chromosome segregation ATPase
MDMALPWLLLSCLTPGLALWGRQDATLWSRERTGTAVFPEAGSPGGYETFDHAKSHHAWLYSNITNIYEKVKVLRGAIAGKCARSRCERTLGKVKKIKVELETVKMATNLTLLGEVIQLLQDSTTLDTLLELKETTEAHEAEIEKLSDKSMSLASTANSQATKVSILESSLEETAALTSDLETAVEGQQVELAAVQVGMGSQADQVASLEATIADQAAAITLLETSVSDLASKIDSLGSSSSSSSSPSGAELEALQTKVSALEDMLTDQAADASKVEALVMSNTMDVTKIGIHQSTHCLHFQL